QADEKYYYVTYSFLDLVLTDNLWQYQLSQKTQKVSRKIKEDIGIYMAKFMAKHYEARTRELKNEKSLAASAGEQKRVEVTEYSGLIGRTLNLAAAVFPGYEPVVKTELPTPENFNLPESINSGVAAPRGGTDNLTQIYNDYIAEHPEIFTTEAPVDTVDGTTDLITSTDTVVSETPVDPEASGILEPESVEVIDLPAQAGLPTLTPVEPAPVEPAPVEPKPAPAPVKSAPVPAPAPEAPAPEAPAPEAPAPTE
ncbi:MAG: hypothetical protein Q8O59_01340, partial [bacterium]|nr:hypothetical protein [bacterium]